MGSVDLKKVLKDVYSAKAATPALVVVSPRPYLMVDGHGDPNTSIAYREAIDTLYPVAYGLRAAVKDLTGDAYKVMPLEGLWWVDDMDTFTIEDKSSWQWTAMISLPDLVTASMAHAVTTEVTRRKDLPSAEDLRMEMFGDGPAAQILHVGPYADEAPTIAALHRFIDDRGCRRRGRHHEIYLSDPRRGDPARRRTIIRQPVER